MKPILLVLSLLVCFAYSANFTVDPVNGPYKTLARAFAARPANDSILIINVVSGSYAINSTLVFAPANKTGYLQINAISGFPLLTCTKSLQALNVNGTDSFSIVGFQFQSCSTTTGAAIKVSSVENVLIQNSVFNSNIASTAGGAIYGSSLGSVLIQNCSFTKNTGPTGAAVDLEECASVQLTNSTFTQNNATTYSGGVQIQNYQTSGNVVVSNCTFNGNTVMGGDGGGLLYKSNASYSSVLTVMNSTFKNNYAFGYGAGIILNDINATIIQSTFINNYVPEGKCGGGGLYVVNSAYFQTIISGSVFELNRACWGSAVSFQTWPWVGNQVLPNYINGSSFSDQIRGTDVFANYTSLIFTHNTISNSSNQAMYLMNSYNNTIQQSEITDNYQGITCNSAGFILLESSVFDNQIDGDINCINTCYINGQWTGSECAFSKCNRDACSVCGGSNSTCTGCDGVIWSGLVYDICGVCGGDNISCLSGCDDLPWSNKTDDICGVCGGNGATCAQEAAVTEKKSNTGVIAGSVVGVVGGLILVAGIVAFVVLRKKKNSEISEMTTYSGMSTPAKNYSQFETAADPTPTSPRKEIVSSIDKYALDYREIKFETQIGDGTFGSVWKCTWRMSPVAVKQIKNGSQLSETQMKDFLAEATLMKNMRTHRNVVAFLGMCMDPLCIVTEFCENGSLWALLASDSKLPMKMRIQILKDVAAGMGHLEKENVIHRDLAARNVLLVQGNSAKVSDFGLSRFSQDERGVSTSVAFGPLKWWAFEVLASRLFTHKSDVWSFGVLCIEVLTRDVPYPNMSTEEFALRVIPDKLTPVSQIPKDTPEGLANIVRRCFDFDPDKRPSFQEIYNSL